MDFDVYFDYLCPFVYRAWRLLRATDRRPRWRFFSLTQVNSEREGWTVWDAAPEETVRGRLAFLAAAAAGRQGRFEEMHEALLTARHEQDRDLDDRGAVRDCARRAGLDPARFEADLSDTSPLDQLRRDHTRGAVHFHVFGTPTFVAADGSAAYVRLREVPEDAEAERAMALIEDILSSRSYLAEVKRPA